MYLVCSDRGLNNFETLEEVKSFLKSVTFDWCLDENYEGENWEELYNECLEEAWFGDIAKVFEIDSFFVAGTKRIPCELDCIDHRAPFSVRRVY